MKSSVLFALLQMETELFSVQCCQLQCAPVGVLKWHVNCISAQMQALAFDYRTGVSNTQNRPAKGPNPAHWTTYRSLKIAQKSLN